MREKKEKYIFRCKSWICVQTQECNLDYFLICFSVKKGGPCQNPTQTHVEVCFKAVSPLVLAKSHSSNVIFPNRLGENFFIVSKGSKCHKCTCMLSMLQMQIQIEAMKECSSRTNVYFEKRHISIVPVHSCPFVTVLCGVKVQNFLSITVKFYPSALGVVNSE